MVPPATGLTLSFVKIVDIYFRTKEAMIIKKLHGLLVIVLVLTALLIACGRKGPDSPPDNTPPTVISTSPPTGSVNFSINSIITVTFSEAMDASTINNQTIWLALGNSIVNGTVTYSGTIVVFTPDADLSPKTLYTLTITVGVKDAKGNAMAKPEICIFETGIAPDNTPPSVLSDTLVPTGNTVPIYTPISVTFSEPMNALTINKNTFQVQVSDGGPVVPNSVTLDHTFTKAIFLLSGPLAYDTIYTVTIVADVPGVPGVKDMAGNTLATNYTWDFKTELPPPVMPYSLTVTKTGTGAGSVTPDTGASTWIWNENIGVGEFEPGTLVILTPEADPSSTFENWSGCDNIIETQCIVNMTADKNVTATFTIKTFTVTPSIAVGSGTISPSTALQVNYNGTATFTIKPNTGYHIATVTGCEGTLEGDIYTTGTYTTAPITANCTVTASFAINTYTISTTTDLNGSIDPPGSITVTHGASQAFTIRPNPGYQIFRVLVDGVTVGEVTSYTFTNVTTDHTISASFAINTYTVTPSVSGGNGTISPSTPQAVNYNGTTNFTLSPATGYHAVMGGTCGGTLSSDGLSYTTNAVTGDCTVEASFTINTYTVTPSVSGGNGTISPSTALQVDYNGTATFIVTPDPGYIIELVTGCNGTLSVDSYATGPITDECTVTASFTAEPPP